MNSFGPVARALALTGIMLGAGAMPAFAGEKEIALLAEYVGTWNGVGQLVGSNAENPKVSCKMAIEPSKQGKIAYAGRCSFSGYALAVTGAIVYNDATNRYEAAMRTTGSFSGRALGRISGDSIIFDVKDRNKDENGTYDINSSMILKGDKISVDFKVTFADSGQSISTSIPFTKS
jgi:hypothetical protein